MKQTRDLRPRGVTIAMSQNRSSMYTLNHVRFFALATMALALAVALMLCSASTAALADEPANVTTTVRVAATEPANAAPARDTAAMPAGAATTADTATATTASPATGSPATSASSESAQSQASATSSSVASSAAASSSTAASGAASSAVAPSTTGSTSTSGITSTTSSTPTTTDPTDPSTPSKDTTEPAKKVQVPKVGSKQRPIADGVYSILNHANRAFSLSIFRAWKRTGAAAVFQRFSATKNQTFILKYDADKKAYTIRVANSKKCLYAGGKSGSVKQGASADGLDAFWKIRKTRAGYAFFNAKTGRAMSGKAYPSDNGAIVVGPSKNNRARWSLYAAKSCKKVSQSTRLNRVIDHIIRTKTSTHDSKSVKFRKLLNYVASNNFSYAHVNNQTRPTYKGWSERYALNMALRHHGNCFSFASLFGYLARGCGYQTKIISGSISLGSASVKHGWVLCKVSGPCYQAQPKASKHGSWHIFDAESVHDYGIPFNLPYYGDYSTGVYRYDYPHLTE